MGFTTSYILMVIRGFTPLFRGLSWAYSLGHQEVYILYSEGRQGIYILYSEGHQGLYILYSEGRQGIYILYSGGPQFEGSLRGLLP
jgi:hypothetical protein